MRVEIKKQCLKRKRKKNHENKSRNHVNLWFSSKNVDLNLCVAQSETSSIF